MDYEKKYNEAIKRAKQHCADYVVETIFPELKESEDEKIRKWIIGVLSTYEHDRDLRNAALAWLEKQGTSYTKKDIDDAYLEGVTNTKYEIEKQYEATYQIRKDIATFIFNYRGNIKDRAKWMDYLGIKVYFIEKQGEQQDTSIQINPSEYINDMGGNGCYLKSTDNVEPKFKVGDWISGYYTNYKVLSVNNNGYVAEDVDGNKINIFFENEMFHNLWNIRDAQDGDVLAVNNEVFIYAHRKQLYSIAVAYCFVDSIGVFHFDGEFGYMESGNSIHPATKEQRDTLERAMTKAGYRWDKEKLKLEKYERSVFATNRYR